MKKTTPVKEKMYIVYDERAITGDTDDATVLVSCGSLKEARSYRKDFNGAIYSYDTKGNELINEHFEEIL